MPKLLQINVTANWGSTGKIAEQIGLKAMKAGWESYIAYGRMMNPSKSKLIKIGSQGDVYLHYALGRYLDNEGLASKQATKKLVQEIERIKPDVIHMHNIHDHYLNYPILFEWISKNDIPVIWTQHDQWATTGGCCYVPDGCQKWRTGCYECPLRKGVKIDRSKKNYSLKKECFTAIKSLTLVPVSEWLGGMIRDSFLGKSDIKVIRNGIDTNVFHFYDGNNLVLSEIGDRKVILGVAAVWDQRKGLQDFYKLAEMLPSDEFVIVIVGKIVTEKVVAKGNSCKIFFVDRTQNVEELACLYSKAMVFVNPTYQDNYPTTNLEAMACGTPVITYRTGGSPEAITSETGAVVEQGDVEGMVEAIKTIGKGDRSKYAVACRNRAEGFFDKDKCFEKYISLYDSLLKP